MVDTGKWTRVARFCTPCIWSLYNPMMTSRNGNWVIIHVRTTRNYWSSPHKWRNTPNSFFIPLKTGSNLYLLLICYCSFVVFSITLIIDDVFTQTIPLQLPIMPPADFSLGFNGDLEKETVPLTYALIADVKIFELNGERFKPFF